MIGACVTRQEPEPWIDLAAGAVRAASIWLPMQPIFAYRRKTTSK
jgi:hypothetical protein